MNYLKKKSFIIFAPVGLECVIAGWGIINIVHQIYAQKMQSLEVRVGDWNMCKRQRPRTFQKFHICAGIQGVLSKSTCDVIKLLLLSRNLKKIYTPEKDIPKILSGQLSISLNSTKYSKRSQI